MTAAVARLACVVVLVAACASPPVPRLAARPTTAAQLTFATRDTTGFEPLAPSGPGRGDPAGASVGPEGGDSGAARAPGAPRGVALVPIGAVDAEQARFLDRATPVVATWCGAPTHVRDPAPAPDAAWTREHRVPWQPRAVEQVRAAYALAHLLPEIRTEGDDVLVAVTSRDLYLRTTQSFVFGRAERDTAHAVMSTARFREAWVGPDDGLRRDDRRPGLAVLLHETGHAHGLGHCRRLRCLMNGLRTRDALDALPLRLCPPCLRRLQRRQGFDVLERYDRLASALRGLGLTQDAELLARRAAVIRRRVPGAARRSSSGSGRASGSRP